MVALEFWMTVRTGKHAKGVAKLEHALVGLGALGLATGFHVLEIVAAAALVGVEGWLVLMTAEAAE